MHLSIETRTPTPTPGKYGALMGATKDFGTFLCPRGWGICCFFLASVLPVGWGISKVLTFLDERGLRRVSCIHLLSQRRFQRGVYTSEQKWQKLVHRRLWTRHGTDKTSLFLCKNYWNRSSFCRIRAIFALSCKRPSRWTTLGIVLIYIFSN